MTLLKDATERELLDALRDRTRGQEPLTRSQWAEARHVIRYAYQDLSGLHTQLEVLPHRWTDVVVELDTQISRLRALRAYLVPRAQGEPGRCVHCGRRIHAVERLADSWEDEGGQMVCPAVKGGGPHEPGSGS